jgi:hypothetical protein
MNEINEQSLPAGRLAGVVEFIPDQVVLIWCHLPFPCLFIIGSTDLPPWFSFACTKGSDKYKPTLLYRFTNL